MSVRRRIVGLAGLLVALLLGGLGLHPASAQAPDVGEPAAVQPGLQRLAECVAQNRRVSAVLLVDESISLQGNDPDHLRVTALQTTLQALTGAVELKVSGPPIAVDVRLAAFAGRYRTFGGWQAVSSTTAGDLADQADAFRARNKGHDTDYLQALRGARRDLSEHAREISPDGGLTVCKAIIWFTDGGYDIGPHEAGYQVAYGKDGDDLSTKKGQKEVIARGRDLLCRPGGLADQLRDEEVSNLAVVLPSKQRSKDDVDPSAFLTALTTGQGVDPKDGKAVPCGDPDSADTGAYLPTDDMRSLPEILYRLVCGIRGCVDQPGATGKLVLEVDRSVAGVQVLVQGTKPGITLVVTPPSGAVGNVSISQATEQRIGSSGSSVRPLSDVAANLDIRFPVRGSDHIGTWTVEASDPKEELKPFFSLAVHPSVVGRPKLELGEPSELEVAVLDRLGQKVPPADVKGTLELAATITDPATGRKVPAEVSPIDAEGVATVRVTVPTDVHSTKVRLNASLGGTAAGGYHLIPAVSVASIPIEFDPALPTITTDQLALPELTKGVGGSDHLTPTADLELHGSKLGDGTACITGVQSTAKPRRSTDLTITSVCVDVPKDDDIPLVAAFGVADKDAVRNGIVRGNVQVHLTSKISDAEATPTVPFAVQTKRGSDSVKKWFLITVLTLLSILIPLAILWVVSWWGSRYDPDEVPSIQVFQMPLRIEHGVVTDLEGLPAEAPSTAKQWPFLASDYGPRSIVSDDLDLRVTPSVSMFGLPTSILRSGTGPSLGSEGQAKVRGRRGRLPHALFGGWAFVADSAELDENGDLAWILGDLLVFADTDTGWQLRGTGTFAAALAAVGDDARLPGLAKALQRKDQRAERPEKRTWLSWPAWLKWRTNDSPDPPDPPDPPDQPTLPPDPKY